MRFHALDWFWTLAFLALMVGGAFWFYRLARRSESEFFLAGRRLPWWLPAASVFSTHTATDTPMWLTGVVYPNGLRGLWYGFFAAWTSVGAFVSARIYRRSLAFTQAEWQSLRYGGLGAELLRGWIAGWQVFMNMFILGWVGMAMGKVGNLAFGWPLWVGLVIPTAITAIYTLAAGYWGVVMGDFLQGIVAAFAIIVVSVLGIAAAGGPHAVTSHLSTMNEAWRLNAFAFTGWISGDFPVAWWATMLVIAIVGGFGMGTSIDWYVEAQRIQSAGSVRDASYGIWAGGFVTLIRNGIWAASILAFFVMLPGLGTNASNFETGWYRLGFELLPVGLLGVFFAAILAIHLSTIASHLNLGALYWTRDLYQRYVRPQATQKQLVWMGRLATAVLLVGSFFYGLMMEQITQWLIFALWLMMAGIWLPNILQVVWWRFNAWGYLASWMANLGIAWLVVWVLPAFHVIPPLPDYLQFWLLMLLGAAVFLPATLLTPPEDMGHLVKYYVMTRPIGWWGPVRDEAVRRGLLPPSSADAAAAAAGRIPGGDVASVPPGGVRESSLPPTTGAGAGTGGAPSWAPGARPMPRRPLIRRTWTPEEADEWSREDWIVIVLSPLSFALAMLGVAKLLLLQGDGLAYCIGAAACVIGGYWVIDPKLRAISSDYEARQAAYLKDLEARVRWDTDDQRPAPREA